MPRKRAHQEGSVSKRKDGRWEAKIRIGGKRHCFYGTTQKAVLDKLAAAKKAVEDGLPAAPTRMTVKDFLDSWLEDTVKPSVRPRTYESYKLTVDKHIVPELGGFKLAELSPVHVQRLLALKSASKLSGRSVQYIQSVLSRALNRAIKWSLIRRNVAALVPSPKVETSQRTFLSTEDAKKLIQAVQGDRLETLYTVALSIGLRRGEILGLRWHNINLEAGTLTVQNQLQRVDKALNLSEPKTRNACRTLSLPTFATDALKAHRLRQAEERIKAKDKWKETGFVFTTRYGGPLEPRNVTRHMQALLVKAKIPSVRFHDLRHTCASLLLAQNVHPRVVMEILGHSKIALTMNTYSHVMPSIQEEAASKMNALFTAQEKAV